MRRLLAADMRRLVRSPLALGAVAAMVLVSAGFVYMQTLSAREVGLERVILLFMSVYGMAAAMLLGLLHGGEYSEGMLRNKLICGCSRIQVYLSQMLVSVVTCVVMYLAALLTALLLGIPLFDLHVSVGHEMLTAGIGFLCCVYYAALYTMIPALCPGRAVAVAVNMAAAMGMLMLSVSISEILVSSAPYTAETVIESWDVRLGELELQRIAFLCKTVNDRAARISESHHLGTFVKGFANRIIDGLSEDFILKRTVNTHNLGIAS